MRALRPKEQKKPSPEKDGMSNLGLFSGMSKPASTPNGFRQFANLGQLYVRHGLEYDLSDALPAYDRKRLLSKIDQ